MHHASHSLVRVHRFRRGAAGMKNKIKKGSPCIRPVAKMRPYLSLYLKQLYHIHHVLSSGWWEEVGRESRSWNKYSLCSGGGKKEGGGIAVALQIHSSFISGAKTAEPPQVLHNSTDNNRRCEQGVGGRVQVFISWGLLKIMPPIPNPTCTFKERYVYQFCWKQTFSLHWDRKCNYRVWINITSELWVMLWECLTKTSLKGWF